MATSVTDLRIYFRTSAFVFVRSRLSATGSALAAVPQFVGPMAHTVEYAERSQSTAFFGLSYLAGCCILLQPYRWRDQRSQLLGNCELARVFAGCVRSEGAPGRGSVSISRSRESGSPSDPTYPAKTRASSQFTMPRGSQLDPCVRAHSRGPFTCRATVLFFRPSLILIGTNLSCEPTQTLILASVVSVLSFVWLVPRFSFAPLSCVPCTSLTHHPLNPKLDTACVHHEMRCVKIL